MPSQEGFVCSALPPDLASACNRTDVIYMNFYMRYAYSSCTFNSSRPQMRLRRASASARGQIIVPAGCLCCGGVRVQGCACEVVDQYCESAYSKAARRPGVIVGSRDQLPARAACDGASSVTFSEMISGFHRVPDPQVYSPSGAPADLVAPAAVRLRLVQARCSPARQQRDPRPRDRQPSSHFLRLPGNPAICSRCHDAGD